MIKTRRAFRPFYLACVALAGVAFIAGCASAPGVVPKSTGWVKDEVSDSYVFGYPLVLMDVAREAATGSGPGQAEVNTLRHAQALPPVGSASPPAPNLDTLSSSGWLDLGSEPVLVALPDSRGRYMDVRALDMWTNVVWSSGAQPGARANGIKAQTIAFVPAGWKGDLPARAQRVEVPSRYVWLLVRIQTHGGDLAAIRKLQRGIRVAPLSQYAASGARGGGRGDPAASGATASGDPVAPGSPREKVAALDAGGFFDRLAQALEDNPPVPDDPHALKILGDLGVHPGDPVALPSGASDALAAGLADGRERVATPPSNLLAGNGWLWVGDNAGNYGPDYALRAYTAYAQPGLGTRDDEVRARVSVDSDGHPLNGANRYVIHFTPKQLPPVRGFWSITAYTTSGALDEDMPVRIAFGDRNGARRNRDGSLDVHVSAERQKAGNWVPTPHGDFQLVLRMYAPKREATDGSWQPPAVERQ
ncbi:DUF1254 domain-containing protein [Paraburkholderia caballeronis]|uniref:Uncharacterized conserved protein n=1 Tax=Paraburkholderia caballeronis TaxID=416943 RepID=A0A1H7VJ33_9BURK|nr:DUF1254 domain-containing protein [Paraburkholderia caballeronis]PXW16016.1 hypothetical protein C7403_12412 [Paraburkholderia caballeronis]PXW93918.1 hypothetical protein C7407_12412 [Paraburkholderia caballeronis]RAJ89047.1 hypothetical protein C7409_12412 [Paraburkholderia caballeronis]TDV09303.1 hypothetical protein C7408_116125 [Paraburkholderia caballeronis]TDV12363.1 hypothetical protein C7406_117125 [Paraburkholderia caballeronis]